MSPGNRPTREQLLVLHAALDEPPRARAAWEAWREAVDFDDIDPGSLRLLPLVYRNLGPDGFDPEVAGRLKGVYRLAWSRNHLLFGRAAAAIERLGGAGIETMALGGAALALVSYRDIGLRPIEDVDLLVPIDRAGEAIEALVQGGWAPEAEPWEGLISAHHSLRLADAGGGRVDLHWFSLWLPADDAPLWRASVPVELAGASTRVPGPADRLLLACLEGTPWNPLPAFPWAADAITAIEAAGSSLDWDRLASEAARRGLTVAVASALRHLDEELGAPVPAETIERLEAGPASRRERAAYRAARRGDNPLRTLRMVRHRHRLLGELDRGGRSHGGFLSFAQRFWRLDSPWQLPGRAAGAVLRRARGAGRSAV
jgi:hypothetical protein